MQVKLFHRGKKGGEAFKLRNKKQKKEAERQGERKPCPNQGGRTGWGGWVSGWGTLSTKYEPQTRRFREKKNTGTGLCRNSVGKEKRLCGSKSTTNHRETGEGKKGKRKI